MTIKINVQKMYYSHGLRFSFLKRVGFAPVRIVRESDWLKLMKLVSAVDECDNFDPSICKALAALRRKRNDHQD